ncbi:uncharacterized protein LOC123503085 [Portunus trituberculatus]|uniref:uncharacterized protein LOC123503085 n=1 Tax=Portunus trituberculatus TaxID=210409 RepID=UPI001E1CC979|nr:uncharacterized protein LOC123503085 [Portunus trituberculatus]
MAENEVTWLRPATDIETLFTQIQETAGLLVSTYGLTIRTAQPLKDEQVQEALVHLFRKVPTLRLCFRRKEDVFWTCEMKREHIDFKAVDRSDQLKLQEELMNHQFNNSEGPLWCARLLEHNSCGGTTSPGLEASFPYSRSLVLANHHGIADGTTNCRTVNCFLRILDDVIAGNPIDDSEQLGELASGEETATLLAVTEEELKENTENLEQAVEEYKKQHEKEKLIVRAFPNQDDPNYITKIISETLDEETTSRFFRRCKQEGVTVNSGFTALTNCSLVDLVRETGMKQDNYPLQVTHAVNMRRYWQGDVSRALGCHIAVISLHETLTHQWRDNFWQYTRDLHTKVHDSLKDKGPLKYWIYYFMVKGDDAVENMLKGRPEVDSDYCLANIGNLDHLIPTDGDHARLAHLVRTTQCWNERICHMLHSLRGRLLYNLCYTSDSLTEQQARRFTDLIFQNLKDMI